MTNDFNPDWLCVCGDLTTLGIVHRKDGPCYIPEPKHDWVDLTDREMMDVIDIDDSPMTMGRKIEAKLKEKNT